MYPADLLSSPFKYELITHNYTTRSTIIDNKTSFLSKFESVLTMKLSFEVFSHAFFFMQIFIIYVLMYNKLYII